MSLISAVPVSDKDKEKARKKFVQTGRGRRQDHGTRDNSHRHVCDESYFTGESDAERAIRRREERQGGIFEEE